MPNSDLPIDLATALIPWEIVSASSTHARFSQPRAKDKRNRSRARQIALNIVVRPVANQGRRDRSHEMLISKIFNHISPHLSTVVLNIGFSRHQQRFATLDEKVQKGVCAKAPPRGLHSGSLQRSQTLQWTGERRYSFQFPSVASNFHPAFGVSFSEA